MQFTDSDTIFVDDGQGRFLEGTFELTVLEATGVYRPFIGGHNHMVDELHLLPPGDGSGLSTNTASASSAANERLVLRATPLARRDSLGGRLLLTAALGPNPWSNWRLAA